MKLIILMLTMTIQSFGGTGSHGGGGFHCSRAGESELLDLWEAKITGLEIVNSEESVEAQVAQAILKLRKTSLSKAIVDKIEMEVNRFDQIKRPIHKEANLPFPDDAKNTLKKQDCKPVGVAQYFDAADEILIDEEIYQSFPKTHQAALRVHEAVYKVMRVDLGQKIGNSRSARRIVGYLFSNLDFDNSTYLTTELAAISPTLKEISSYSTTDSGTHPILSLYTDENHVALVIHKLPTTWLLFPVVKELKEINPSSRVIAKSAFSEDLIFQLPGAESYYYHYRFKVKFLNLSAGLPDYASWDDYSLKNYVELGIPNGFLDFKESERADSHDFASQPVRLEPDVLQKVLKGQSVDSYETFSSNIFNITKNVKYIFNGRYDYESKREYIEIKTKGLSPNGISKLFSTSEGYGNEDVVYRVNTQGEIFVWARFVSPQRFALYRMLGHEEIYLKLK